MNCVEFRGKSNLVINNAKKLSLLKFKKYRFTKCGILLGRLKANLIHLETYMKKMMITNLCSSHHAIKNYINQDTQVLHA